MRRCGLVACLAGCLFLASCKPATAVWVQDGSTAEALAFGLSKERGGEEPIRIDLLRVDRCDVIGGWQRGGYPPAEQAARFIRRSGSEIAALHGVAYGDVPDGFEETESAKPLQPGCYEAVIAPLDGDSSTRFRIDSSGTVREIDRGEPNGAGAQRR